MQFYYDINLNFDDNYINYHMWEECEHFNRLPIFRVLNVREILDNEVLFDLEYKNIIVSDGVISLGLELLGGKAIFISSLPYQDELKINKLVMTMDKILEFKILNKRNNKLYTKIEKIKNIYIDRIENGTNDFIKLIYYEVTGKLSNNVNYMKKFLSNDIYTNFSDKYYQLYDMIIIGD